MSFAPKSETQRQMAAEIGIMRYEAVGHFLTDGDYKADNEGDFEGAFADYAQAWSLLVTAQARAWAGPEILEAIAEFADRSGSKDLKAKAELLRQAYREETACDGVSDRAET